MSNPIPPRPRPIVRKVQGSICESAIFVIGQLKPHINARSPSNRVPRVKLLLSIIASALNKQAGYIPVTDR